MLLDLKTLISKTAIDPELTPCQKQHAARRPRSRTRRIQAGIQETISSMGPCVGRRQDSSAYRFQMPTDRYFTLLLFPFRNEENGDRVFWWPEKTNDTKTNVKDCTESFVSCKNLTYQLPKKKHSGIPELNETVQEIQIDFTGKLTSENIYGDVLRRKFITCHGKIQQMAHRKSLQIIEGKNSDNFFNK